MFRNLITVLIVFVASTLASYGVVMAQAGGVQAVSW